MKNVKNFGTKQEYTEFIGTNPEINTLSYIKDENEVHAKKKAVKKEECVKATYRYNSYEGSDYGVCVLGNIGGAKQLQLKSSFYHNGYDTTIGIYEDPLNGEEYKIISTPEGFRTMNGTWSFDLPDDDDLEQAFIGQYFYLIQDTDWNDYLCTCTEINKDEGYIKWETNGKTIYTDLTGNQSQKNGYSYYECYNYIPIFYLEIGDTYEFGEPQDYLGLKITSLYADMRFGCVSEDGTEYYAVVNDSPQEMLYANGPSNDSMSIMVYKEETEQPYFYSYASMPDMETMLPSSICIYKDYYCKDIVYYDDENEIYRYEDGREYEGEVAFENTQIYRLLTEFQYNYYGNYVYYTMQGLDDIGMSEDTLEFVLTYHSEYDFNDTIRIKAFFDGDLNELMYDISEVYGGWDNIYEPQFDNYVNLFWVNKSIEPIYPKLSNYFDAIIVDDKDIDLCEFYFGGYNFYYNVSTEGLHTVYYKLKNSHVIPSNMFCETDATTIELPDSINTIGAYSCSDCEYLSDVYIKENANNIQYYAFGTEYSYDFNIHLYSENVPMTYADITSDYGYGNCELYVPEKSIDLYRNDYTFSKFSIIKRIKKGVVDEDHCLTVTYNISEEYYDYSNGPIRCKIANGGYVKAMYTGDYDEEYDCSKYIDEDGNKCFLNSEYVCEGNYGGYGVYYSGTKYDDDNWYYSMPMKPLVWDYDDEVFVDEDGYEYSNDYYNIYVSYLDNSKAYVNIPALSQFVYKIFVDGNEVDVNSLRYESYYWYDEYNSGYFYEFQSAGEHEIQFYLYDASFIPRSMFTKTPYITKVEFPNLTEIIEPYAFYNCNDMETVHMKDKTRGVGYCAFSQQGDA